jgi:hypothetical protein
MKWLYGVSMDEPNVVKLFRLLPQTPCSQLPIVVGVLKLCSEFLFSMPQGAYCFRKEKKKVKKMQRSLTSRLSIDNAMHFWRSFCNAKKSIAKKYPEKCCLSNPRHTGISEGESLSQFHGWKYRLISGWVGRSGSSAADEPVLSQTGWHGAPPLWGGFPKTAAQNGAPNYYFPYGVRLALDSPHWQLNSGQLEILAHRNLMLL